MSGTTGLIAMPSSPVRPDRDGPFHKLLAFLNRLDKSNFSYRLSHIREETVAIELTVPGERWEVEFFPDGRVEVERFRSDGHIADESVLDELFTTFA
jgi:hypothetical protein